MKSIFDSGLKPEGQPLKKKSILTSGIKPGVPDGPTILKSPLTTIDLNGRKVTVKKEVALALALADQDMKAADPNSKGILVNESFRTGEDQTKKYGDLEGGKKGRVAPPGTSFHQTGQALDVANWKEAEPFLRKYNLQNNQKGDENHFSVGEFDSKPILTSRPGEAKPGQAPLPVPEPPPGGVAGFLNGAMGKLGEQFNSLGPVAGQVVNALGNPIGTGLSMAPGLAKYIGNTALDVAKGAEQTFSNAPQAARDTFRTIQEAATNPDNFTFNPYKLIVDPSSREANMRFLNTPSVSVAEGVANATDQTKKGLLETGSLIPSPVGQFVAGAANSFEQGRQEGLPASQLLGGGLVQGAEQGLLALALGRLFKSAPEKALAEARKAGIPETAITSTQREIPQGQGQEILKAGEAANPNKVGASNLAEKPFDVAGKELNRYYDEVVKTLKNTGKEIGAIKQTIKGAGRNMIMDITPTLQKVYQFFDENGIKAKIGNEILDFSPDSIERITRSGNPTLEFGDSSMALNEGDKGMANFVFDKVKNGALDAGNAPNFISALQKRIYSGGGDIVDGKALAEIVRKGVREQVNGLADDMGMPQLRTLNENYNLLTDAADEYRKFVGTEGLKSPQVLRRSMSNVGEVPKDFLSNVNDISNRFGFQNGKDMLNKADLAMSTENSMGVTQPSSMKGQIKQGAIELAAGHPVKSAATMVSAFKPTPNTAEAFMNLVKAGPANMSPLSQVARGIGIGALSSTATGGRSLLPHSMPSFVDQPPLPKPPIVSTLHGHLASSPSSSPLIPPKAAPVPFQGGSFNGLGFNPSPAPLVPPLAPKAKPLAKVGIGQYQYNF